MRRRGSASRWLQGLGTVAAPLLMWGVAILLGPACGQGAESTAGMSPSGADASRLDSVAQDDAPPDTRSAESRGDASSEASGARVAPRKGDGLFLASDGKAVTQLALFDFETGNVRSRVNFDAIDVVPTGTSNCIRFLDRRRGTVWFPRSYSPEVFGFRINVNPGVPIPTPVTDAGFPDVDAGPPRAYAAVPTDSVPGPTANDFVLARERNDVLVVSGTDGVILKSIDLSSFVAPGDGDGRVDAVAGVYDDVQQRIFVLLARYDRTKAPGETDLPSCERSPTSILVAVDALKHKLVEFPGTPGRLSVELAGVRPVALQRDVRGGELIVLHAGCKRADGAVDRAGVEAVGAKTGVTRWLTSTTTEAFPKRLVVVDRSQYLLQFGSAPGRRRLYSWDPTSPWPGRAISDPPITFAHVRDGWVLGVREAIVDAGASFGLELVDTRGAERRVLQAPLWSLPDAKPSGEGFGWP